MWGAEQAGASREQDTQTHSSEGRTEGREGRTNLPSPRASRRATVTLNVDGNSSRGQRASGGA